MIEYVRHKVSFEKEFAIKALLQLYSFQTDVEKDSNGEYSDERNGLGFTLFDREILTSFAQQSRNEHRLSWRQMEILHKRLKKYARQLVAITPRDKLIANMCADGWLDSDVQVSL
jgi:hypothetical protein